MRSNVNSPEDTQRPSRLLCSMKSSSSDITVELRLSKDAPFGPRHACCYLTISGRAFGHLGQPIHVHKGRGKDPRGATSITNCLRNIQFQADASNDAGGLPNGAVNGNNAFDRAALGVDIQVGGPQAR